MLRVRKTQEMACPCTNPPSIGSTAPVTRTDRSQEIDDLGSILDRSEPSQGNQLEPTDRCRRWQGFLKPRRSLAGGSLNSEQYAQSGVGLRFNA